MKRLLVSLVFVLGLSSFACAGTVVTSSMCHYKIKDNLPYYLHVTDLNKTLGTPHWSFYYGEEVVHCYFIEDLHVFDSFYDTSVTAYCRGRLVTELFMTYHLTNGQLCPDTKPELGD